MTASVVDFSGPLAAHLSAFLRFLGASYPIELQALDVPDGRWTVNRFAHARTESEVIRLATEAERWGAPGVYVVLGQIHEAVATRAEAGRWHPQRKGESTTDSDITRRLVLYVDIDPRRARGTSATDAECAKARGVADSVRFRLEEAFGQGAIGHGSSGNGSSIFVALDVTGQCTELVKRILGALDTLYSTPEVHVDASVCDPKRLGPCFGTTKRKGAAGLAARPHRRSAFTAPAHVRRVPLAELEAFAVALEVELPQPAPAPARQSAPFRPAAAADDPFQRANAVPVPEVLEWLGLLAGDQPTCPGCRESDGSSVAVVGNGVRCMHARCAAEGHPSKPGFYSVVDIVAKARGCEPIEAVRELGRRFDCEVPRAAPERTPAERKDRGRTDRTPAPSASNDGRPVVTCGVDLHRVVDDASAVVGAEPSLYQRDGVLVRVVRVPADEEKAKDEAGTPHIRSVAQATLREVLARRAVWRRYDGRSDDYVPCLPPPAVVEALAARGQWRTVRPLVGILEAPSLRPDGSVICEPGYDAATGCLYDPAPELVGLRVPERPSQADANAALLELCEVWSEFPWATEPQRMVPVALLLTLVARPAIRGSCPGFVVDAPTRGTGKTLANDAAAMIATGRVAAKMSYPADDAELEKVLASYALRGAAVVNFDNVTGRFGGGPLDKVLTCGGEVELRVLGKSEIPSLRWRALVMASGNNLDVGGDTARRLLWCRMESALERPEERTGFAHPSLIAWCRAERPRLARAALVVLRAHVAAGCPDMGIGTWGSFEEWCALVPQAIAYAGGANVLEARAAAAGREEPEKVALEAILTHLPPIAGAGGVSARDLVSRLYTSEHLRGHAPPDGLDALRDGVEALVATQPGRAPAVRLLGYALRRLRRRVVGGRYLDCTINRVGVAVWRVNEAGAPP